MSNETVPAAATAILPISCALAIALAGCGAEKPAPVLPPLGPTASVVAPATEAPPLARLPSDTRPTHYALELEIVPGQPRFGGQVRIDLVLDHPRSTIWLHGNGLSVEHAEIEQAGRPPQRANYQQVDDSGVAAVTLPTPAQAGAATLQLSFSAPFGQRLSGLYHVEVGGQHYAFTQLEAVWARMVFPCFDEPAFKTPWDLAVVAPNGQRVIANTHAVGREPAGKGLTRVRFATTEPLPSYLIALAVGPLDVVEAPDIAPNAVRHRPLPFRGVAAKGRGAQLAYALKHTPEIIAELERYFAIPYPYDKLDVLAVPDKDGAMENPGAVMFREWLLLLDEQNASIAQKRAFAYVAAHELAHQWFGDLVTMPWWDDIWLNEAFATWMGHRVVGALYPDYQAPIEQLAGVHRAMAADSLLSARQIRQPVHDSDDIHDAFDLITYRKGGGVLSMFERWLGPAVFQRGIQTYIRAHRNGLATAADLLAALSKASGKDVATPFRTFLMQPGLPQLDVTPRCVGGKATLGLAQSRYLPLGSKGDRKRSWQVPVCVRFFRSGKASEQCTLLSEPAGEIDLGPGCPDWVMPNAHAAGYYQFTLPPADLGKLSQALGALDVREKMALGSSVWASFKRGALAAPAVWSTLEPLAAEAHPRVAAAPMKLLGLAHYWLEGDPLAAAVETTGRKLFSARFRRLGWQPKPGESPERTQLRSRLVGFLALAAKDPAVRRAAITRAQAYLGYGTDGKIHPDRVAADLRQLVLMVAGEEADPALFDALLADLGQTQDEDRRAGLLAALGSARDPQLAKRARALCFDKRLKTNEVVMPLYHQLDDPRTRPATFAWLGDNLDRLIERLSPRRASGLARLTTVFCSEPDATRIEQLFGPRVSHIPGGPRQLAQALEQVRLCAARKQQQLGAVRALFERH